MFLAPGFVVSRAATTNHMLAGSLFVVFLLIIVAVEVGCMPNGAFASMCLDTVFPTTSNAEAVARIRSAIVKIPAGHGCLARHDLALADFAIWASRPIRIQGARAVGKLEAVTLEILSKFGLDRMQHPAHLKKIRRITSFDCGGRAQR